MLPALLADVGHVVATAADGATAWRLLHTIPGRAVIVLNVATPELNGIEVLEGALQDLDLMKFDDQSR